MKARERCNQLGSYAPTPAEGALLASLVASSEAKHIVEVGGGGGLSALYLLQNASQKTVLTSIDSEPEYHLATRETLKDAKVAPSRFRLIAGNPSDVLSRLAPKSYDLVTLNLDPVSYPQAVEQALSLLTKSGTLVIQNALWFDQVPDPTKRDVQTVAMRQSNKALLKRPDLHTVLIPIGRGILVNTRLA